MGDLQNMLSLPLSNMNKLGVLSTKKLSKVFFLIISSQILLVIIHVILMFLQFLYMENNIQHYVENVEGLAIYIQFLGKLLSCLYNKRKFLNLVNYTTEHFWTTKKYSKIVDQNTKELTDKIRFAQRVYMYLVTVGVIFAMIKSPVKDELGTGHWSMEKGYLFRYAQATLYIDGTLAALGIGCFDGLFLGFCYEGIIQCKILYAHLKSLSVKDIITEHDFKNYCEKMQYCIKHHAVLLRYHKDLREVYSVPLLIQFLTATPFTCIEMYAISESSNMNSSIMYGNYLVIAVLQLTFYCHTANHLTDELSSISDAVYNSDWHSEHIKTTRAPNTILIQRAQQKNEISACGLIVMDLETLVKLLKFCLTTCLTLRGLKK